MSQNKKLLGAGILSAMAASLCCITPILALLAGTTGMASTFSWIEPFRPYLIGITVLVLGFAWYQNLKPVKVDDCNCETDPKTGFMQSRMFMVIVTLFASIMLAFPYFSGIFYPNNKPNLESVNSANLKQVEFAISGMTCTGCEVHITNELNKIEGISNLEVSYQTENALIEFDSTLVNSKTIEEAINATGYTVIKKDSSVLIQKVVEIRFLEKSCDSYLHETHQKFVQTTGVIEVCSYPSEDSNSKEKVLLIAYNEELIVKNELGRLLEINPSIRINTITEKESFYE